MSDQKSSGFGHTRKCCLFWAFSIGRSGRVGVGEETFAKGPRKYSDFTAARMVKTSLVTMMKMADMTEQLHNMIAGGEVADM